MNQPGRYDLEVYRGDTHAFRVRLWQDNGMTVPVDLTGTTVKAQIRERSGGLSITALALTISLPNTINAQLTAVQTAALPAGGVWDLQLTEPGAKIHTVLAGRVRVVADVTDSDLPVGALAAS